MATTTEDQRVLKLPKVPVVRKAWLLTVDAHREAFGKNSTKRGKGWLKLLTAVPAAWLGLLVWVSLVLIWTCVLGWVMDLPRFFKDEDDTDLRRKLAAFRWLSLVNTALLIALLAVVFPAAFPFGILVLGAVVTNRVTAQVWKSKTDPFAPKTGFVKKARERYAASAIMRDGEAVGSWWWCAAFVSLLVPAVAFVIEGLKAPELAAYGLIVPDAIRDIAVAVVAVVALVIAMMGGVSAGRRLRAEFGHEVAFKDALREKLILALGQESASGQKQFMTAEEAGLLRIVRSKTEAGGWEITLPTGLWPLLKDEGALAASIREELDTDMLQFMLSQVWEGHFAIGPLDDEERRIRRNLKASGGLTKADPGFDEVGGDEKALPRELLADLTSWELTARAAAPFAALGSQLVGFNVASSRGIFEAEPNARPRARVKPLELAAGASERTVRDAAERLARLERAAIVGIDVLDRTVTLTPVLPAVVALRDRIAELLSAGKQVSASDIDVSVLWSADGHAETVTVRTRAQVVDPSAARERWKAVLSQLAPLVGYRLVFDAATGEVVFAHGDPLASGVAYRWDEPVSHTSIPAFADEDGDTVCLGLFERNILLGGVPGSGKSGGATAILAGISRLPGVALVGLDPKRVELSLWEPRFSMIAKLDEHASAVLDALLVEMERRYKWLDEQGLKKVPLDRLDEMPLIVVLIDELAEVVSGGVTKDEKGAQDARSTAIRRLIAKGRAAGFVVITATQKPSANIVPTELRDLIQQRVGFATTNPSMTDVILGFGASQLGGLCHEIPTDMPGTAYILNEGSRVPKRVRAFWIPDEDVAGIAKSTADKRVLLPFLPTEAQALAAAAAAAQAGPGQRGSVPAAKRSAPAPRQSPAPVASSSDDAKWLL